MHLPGRNKSSQIKLAHSSLHQPSSHVKVLEKVFSESLEAGWVLISDRMTDDRVCNWYHSTCLFSYSSSSFVVGSLFHVRPVLSTNLALYLSGITSEWNIYFGFCVNYFLSHWFKYFLVAWLLKYFLLCQLFLNRSCDMCCHQHELLQADE